MNRRFDVMETLGLNRRTRNGGASRKSGPKSSGKASRPQRKKPRLARLEQLEERALLAVSASEFATDDDFAVEVAELTERKLLPLDLAEPTAADTSAAVALLDLIAQTPSTVSYGPDASCVARLDPTLANPPSIIAFGTEAITVSGETLAEPQTRSVVSGEILELEPNNNRSDAYELGTLDGETKTLEQRSGGSGGDDWFAFTLLESG
ncbi:MAG: hypothetical protein IKK39_00785, partial [Thermoguttaceae bacterium]|nr:hypothetical protein [Thermoguttaceae bacterium]